MLEVDSNHPIQIQIRAMARTGRGYAARIRRACTRENLLRNAKTLAGVIPLTILVWVVAEQQELVTSTAYLRISVQSADPAHRAVTMITPYDGTIQVTLQGSQAGIDHVKTLLHKTLISDPMEIDVGTSLPSGPRQPLLSLDEIASNHLFFSQGVTVTACSPDAPDSEHRGLGRSDGHGDRAAGRTGAGERDFSSQHRARARPGFGSQ